MSAINNYKHFWCNDLYWHQQKSQIVHHHIHYAQKSHTGTSVPKKTFGNSFGFKNLICLLILSNNKDN